MKHLETVTSIRVFWLLRALRRLLREKKGKDRLKIWKFIVSLFGAVTPMQPALCAETKDQHKYAERCKKTRFRCSRMVSSR